MGSTEWRSVMGSTQWWSARALQSIAFNVCVCGTENKLRRRRKNETIYLVYFSVSRAGSLSDGDRAWIPKSTFGSQTSLFISAGASYIACILSTFPFWRETAIRFYRRRNLAVILPWLVIGVNIIWMIWEIQSQNWAMEAILQAFSRLIVVLLFAEIIVITWQVNSEH